MKFSREDERQARDVLVSVRFTAAQTAFMSDMVKAMSIAGGRAELIRRAIDFWIVNDRHAKQAAQRLGRRET